MRLALKSTIALLLTYAAVLIGAGSWMVIQLRELSMNLAEDTAKLVGTEIARTVTGSALEELLRGDEASRERLTQVVGGITERSGVVTSLAVIDRSGTVVAGDGAGDQGARPDIIFGPTSSTRIISVGSPIKGEFFLALPLNQGGELVGYVRLSMRSQRIGHLAYAAVRTWLLTALVGFCAVGGVGIALHLQMSRRSRALVEELEQAVRGEAGGERRVEDEFSRALGVARQVGKELTEARGERQQTRQRMAALIKAVDVGTLVIDSDTGLAFANGRAAELLGFPDPTTLAQHWDAEVRAGIEELLRRFTTAFGRNYELPARQGSPRLKLEFYALGDGAPEGYLVLLRNAESIDALQSELGLAMQMRGLTRFYAAFAHDLRAPLNAMVMTLELLKVTIQGRGDDQPLDHEKIARYIKVLNDEIQRLNRQVRTLLTHTAPPSGERRDLDLRDLLQNLHDLLAPQAKRQRVAIAIAVPAEPVTLNGYADRLKQAMLNVLINALEAMPDGGELRLELARVDGGAEIAVRDNGPGIPPEILASIFEMQFTTKSGGSGVGLFVARSVIEAHGGTIAVHSDENGNGTTFQIQLPLQPV